MATPVIAARIRSMRVLTPHRRARLGPHNDSGRPCTSARAGHRYALYALDHPCPMRTSGARHGHSCEMSRRAQRIIEAAQKVPVPEGTYAVGLGLLISGLTAYAFQIIAFN